MINNSEFVKEILSSNIIDTERKTLKVLPSGELLEKDFISATLTTKGTLYGANMKLIEITLVGKKDFTGEWLNYNRYISNKGVDGGREQKIDYGDFGIIESKYDDTSETTKLTGYDKMLQTNVPYDDVEMGLTYPKTIQDIISRLATVCKLELQASTYPNSNVTVLSDLWANQSYTYRDVLEHIAQATASTISIKKGKLVVHQIEQTNFMVAHKFESLKVGEKYGKINIINISQEPQHYNKYEPSNALEIPINDRRELSFQNNPILNVDMVGWAKNLLPKINNVEYHTIESKAIGYGIFEVGDMVKVNEFGTGIDYDVVITNETFTNMQSVITEINSDKPLSYKNQYLVETDEQRQGQTTFLIVDQQNGIIQALVNKVTEVENQTAELTIKVDEIDIKVNNLSSGSIIGNLNPRNYLGWEGGSVLTYIEEYSKLRYIEGLTYAMGFQPVFIPMSLSEWGLSFFNNGSATSPYGYVVPNERYSFKAKVQRFKPFSVDLLEFENMASSFHKSTRFTFTSPQSYVQFTSELDPKTVFVRLRLNITGVTTLDRFEITELMYNRGLPKEYFVSGTEALVYAQSSINLMNNRIGLVVDEVKLVDDKTTVNKGMIEVMGGQVNINAQSIDSVSKDIHNAGVEINAVEGVTTYGKKFEVKSEDKSSTYMKVTDNGVESHKMTAIDMIATNATIQSGKIAGFNISGNNLVGQDISVKPNEITVGETIITSEEQGSVTVTRFDGNWFNFGKQIGSLQTQIQLNGRGFVFELGANGVRGVYVDQVTPKLGGGGTIGNQERRYATIFLQNQPNVSSDKNLKYDVSNIDELLLDSFESLKEKSYKTKHDDKHSFGYIAQDVESCLYDYVNKVWDKDEAENQMKDFKLLSRDSEFMSLLYIEVMIIMQAVERRRNDRLEERLNRLEELLKKEGK